MPYARRRSSYRPNSYSRSFSSVGRGNQVGGSDVIQNVKTLDYLVGELCYMDIITNVSFGFQSPANGTSALLGFSMIDIHSPWGFDATGTSETGAYDYPSNILYFVSMYRQAICVSSEIEFHVSAAFPYQLPPETAASTTTVQPASPTAVALFSLPENVTVPTLATFPEGAQAVAEYIPGAMLSCADLADPNQTCHLKMRRTPWEAMGVQKEYYLAETDDETTPGETALLYGCSTRNSAHGAPFVKYIGNPRCIEEGVSRGPVYYMWTTNLGQRTFSSDINYWTLTGTHIQRVIWRDKRYTLIDRAIVGATDQTITEEQDEDPEFIAEVKRESDFLLKNNRLFTPAPQPTAVTKVSDLVLLPLSEDESDPIKVDH